MRFGVGHTIVVCRPDQVREAAIVASCLPSDRLTPIVAVEPSPVPRDQHIEWYQRYRQVQQQMQSRIGTPLGMAEVVRAPTGDVLATMDAHHSLSARLAPYRSWAKRNEMVSTIAGRMGIERVVYLHEFRPDELGIHDPGLDQAYDRYAAANGRAPGEHGRMFTDLAELHLTDVDLADLDTAAWRLLRDPATAPERVIEVPRDNPDCYPRALLTALRLGAVLRAVDEPDTTTVDELFAQVNPDGDEAVLVEDTGDATTLVAALYAHHRAARLVVAPRPNLEPVQRAVAAQQARVSAASRSTGVDTRSPRFAELLDRFLFHGGKRPFSELETAVTSQVPERVVAEVGDRRLTAFTTGIPYSFVRTDTVDWSDKPIGHVASDAMLVILNELYSTGVARPDAGFSLIFDPGFFRVSETEDVLRSVRGHFTHPVLLSGQDASMPALQALPRHLSVELIFFNTHGSDDGIELSDIPLPSYLLPQLFELRHRPIVFNNSCQSWTGVGREFVRIGARGYIGTLWDIPSKPAADFARVVMKRLTEDEAPVSDVITHTGLAWGVERAYLFVGTVNGRLGHWSTETTGGADLLAHAAALTAAADESPADVAKPLLREIAALRRAAASTDVVHTEAFADALLAELGLLARQPTDDNAADELVIQLDDTLRRLDLPPAVVASRWAGRFELTSQLHERAGDLTAALADLDRCLGYRAALPPRADLLLRRGQFLNWRGDTERARQQASAAYDLYTEQHDDGGLMRTLGLLGQVSTRLNRLDEAMDHATRGYALAQRLQDRQEQGAFLLDQCGLQQLRGDFAAATKTATTALETFRAIGNEAGELSALGKLGACLRATGNLRAAGGCALTGLEQAQKLGKPREVAAFHHDLAQALDLDNRPDKALAHYRDAVSTLVESGYWELAAHFVVDLLAAAIRAGDGDTLWSAATWSCAICRETGRQLWTPVLLKLVDGLRHAFVVSPPEVAAQRFSVLYEQFQLTDEAGHPDHVILISDVLKLLLWWFVGEDQPGAIRIARALDAQTGGVLGLAEFVQIPYLTRIREQ